MIQTSSRNDSIFADNVSTWVFNAPCTRSAISLYQCKFIHQNLFSKISNFDKNCSPCFGSSFRRCITSLPDSGHCTCLLMLFQPLFTHLLATLMFWIFTKNLKFTNSKKKTNTTYNKSSQSNIIVELLNGIALRQRQWCLIFLGCFVVVDFSLEKKKWIFGKIFKILMSNNTCKRCVAASNLSRLTDAFLCHSSWYAPPNNTFDESFFLKKF